MKNYCLFNYEYLFNDHFAQVSEQAKLLYIKMCFYANNGFVSNPISICDSLNYDKGTLQELINIDEVLTLPNRQEVFITAYFIHNRGVNPYSFLKTPYAIYWKGKLFIKKNGVATFKPQKEEEQAEDKALEPTFDELIDEIENYGKNKNA